MKETMDKIWNYNSRAFTGVITGGMAIAIAGSLIFSIATKETPTSIARDFDPTDGSITIHRFPQLTADDICEHSPYYRKHSCDHEENFNTTIIGLQIWDPKKQHSTILLSTELTSCSEEFLYYHEIVHHLIDQGKIKYPGSKKREEALADKIAEEITDESCY